MHSVSLIQRLFDLLPPRAFVLDLGCGTGLATRALARAGHEATGLDADVDALETARVLGEEDPGDGGDASPARFVAGDMRALSFKDASFDAVLCADVLHWSPDARAFAAACEEVRRVLRPRGLWAARLRTLEASPGAAALADGRHRLADGAEWFLADGASLEEPGAWGEWVEPPAPDGEGSAAFILRKRAP